MENRQIQLFELLGLSIFIDPKNVRQKTKKTPFKVLNSVYLLTKNNLEKGRTEHYPSKELIADVAGCCRSEVTKFITSEVCEEFCHVHREFDPITKKFKANRYFLKNWVYDWFQLFWRSGMMKHFRTNHKWWISDFKKRIYNWLMPLLDAGKTVKEIYEGFVNKLSTEKPLKRAAVNPLKRADIKPTEYHEAYGTRISREGGVLDLPSMQDFNFIGTQLVTRFGLREGDINSLMRSFNLIDLKRGYNIHNQRLKSGFVPKSPVAAFISAVQHGKRALRL